MAKRIDYIAEQINKLSKTIDGDTLLKNEGMYFTAKYIATNPKYLNGNSFPYVKNPMYGIDYLVSATYGVNILFWKELKLVSDGKKSEMKLKYFKEKILNRKESDKEVTILIEKLFNKPVSLYNNLVDALANLINYKVMNITFQSQSVDMFDKVYTNLNFSSLPNGVINSIVNKDINFFKDKPSIDETSMEIILKKFCPKNINLETYPISKTSKFFNSVINKDLNSITIKSIPNRAEGYITNDKI